VNDTSFVHRVARRPEQTTRQPTSPARTGTVPCWRPLRRRTHRQARCLSGMGRRRFCRHLPCFVTINQTPGSADS
jgi:hypothetical protein